MRTSNLAIIILLSFLLLACAPAGPTPTTTPPGVDVANADVPASANTTQAAAAAAPERKMDPAVAKLFANSGSVKSYSFDVAFLPDNRAPYKYLVKGNKAKIILLEQLVFPDGNADVVYIDYDQESAFAYCVKLGAFCTDLKRARAVNFADYAIVLPPSWIDNLKYGTKTRSLTFENVPVDVVQYAADGKQYEAYIHNYWGYPLRIAIKNAAGDIVGGYEYRSMSFQDVKDADVTPPQ